MNEDQINEELDRWGKPGHQRAADRYGRKSRSARQRKIIGWSLWFGWGAVTFVIGYWLSTAWH